MTNAEARFNKIHIRKMYACLAVTCHLHFWQNDRDFLRATATVPVQKPGRHCHLYRTMRHRPVAGRQRPTGDKGWGNSGPVTPASLHSSPATASRLATAFLTGKQNMFLSVFNRCLACE